MQVLKEICPRFPWEIMKREVFATFGTRRGIRGNFLRRERLELGWTSLGEQGRKGRPQERGSRPRGTAEQEALRPVMVDLGKELSTVSLEEAQGPG